MSAGDGCGVLEVITDLSGDRTLMKRFENSIRFFIRNLLNLPSSGMDECRWYCLVKNPKPGSSNTYVVDHLIIMDIDELKGYNVKKEREREICSLHSKCNLVFKIKLLNSSFVNKEIKKNPKISIS